jgi:hypothetical protein
MKVAFFDTHQFERNIFQEKNHQNEIQFQFLEIELSDGPIGPRV